MVPVWGGFGVLVLDEVVVLLLVVVVVDDSGGAGVVVVVVSGGSAGIDVVTGVGTSSSAWTTFAGMAPAIARTEASANVRARPKRFMMSLQTFRR